MKKSVLLLVFLGLSVWAINAQDCAQDLSIFSEYAKVKNYNEAYIPWKNVYDNCPDMHPATFIYGEYILKSKLEQAPADQKQAYIQMLNELYDKYHQYFPNRMSAGDVKIKKAMLLYEEKTGNSQQIFSLLDDAFKNYRADFKNQKALYLYFVELVNLYEAGEKQLQDVFNVYDDITDKIQEERDEISKNLNTLLAKETEGTLSSKEEKLLKSLRLKIENYEKIGESVDARLGKLADCENLIPLYEKNFEANKTDEEWLKRAAGKMSDKDCTSSALFEKLVTALHQLSPSASSAYYLGVLNDKNGNAAKAINYYNEAVNLQTDNFKKSKILTQIARKYTKQNAVLYANKALQLNPSNTDAYRIIANAYSSSANECGSTPFEKRAIYWLAAEVARKGGLDSLAKQYEALAPSRSDIFESGMAGKTVKFNCWIGRSITVPSL